MMTTFWTKGGSVVTDGSGHPVLCANCPCGAKSGLYICGKFTTIGGTSMNRVAYWDGAAWNAMGSGMNGVVYDLTVYNSDLVAVGAFTTADGNTVNYVAIWNGFGWTTLGGANDYAFCTLTADDGKLWVGGRFSGIGGVNLASGLAYYDGSWHDGSSGISGSDIPNVLYQKASGTLYMGTQGGKVFSWNGSSWTNTGTTGQSFVNALVVANDGFLYSAGVPTTLANHGFMKLSAGTWSPSNVSALYSYATAVETGYGGTNVQAAKRTLGSDYVYLWTTAGVDTDITSSHTPTTATDTAGLGFDVLGGNLIYAGGLATDGTTRVASYNGSVWSALGSQPNDDVITCKVVP